MSNTPIQASPDWNLVEVRLRAHYLDGSPAKGSVTAKAQLRRFLDEDSVAPFLVVANDITAKFNNQGLAVLYLPATDDPDITPRNFTYTITESIVGVPANEYEIEVPLAMQASGIELARVQTIAPSTGEVFWTKGLIVHGDGPPGTLVGGLSDYYIDDENHDLYGPKTLETGWGTPYHLASPDDLALSYAQVLTATEGDQLTRINDFLADVFPTGAVKRLVGNFSVAGTISVPAGVRLDLTGATITQTSSGSITLAVAGAGATVLNGTLIGKGTDYAPGSSTPTIVGLSVTASDVAVVGTRFEKHAGAGIKGLNAPRLRLDRITVVGVGGITTIPAVDANCYGVYLHGGCTDVSVANLDITDVSIGLIGSIDSSYLSLSNVRIDRVPGQHGIYLQNGTGLKVDGVRCANVYLNGMKVQLSASSADHAYGASISNVSGLAVGDSVLSINNTDTDLAAGKKFKGLTIANVRGVDSLRVLYLANVRGGSFSNVGGENTTNTVLTIIDCQDVEGVGVQSRISGRAVVDFSTIGAGSTGSSTRRVTLRNVRGYNPCGQNSGSYPAAVNIAGPVGPSDNTDITLDSIDVYSDQTAGAATYMRFGLNLHSTVDQSSLRVLNFRAKGFTSNPAQLASATVPLGEWNDSEAATTIANFPVGLPTPIGTLGNKRRYVCNALPVSGIFQFGDVIENSAPVAGGAPGWVVTSSGALNGGTWAATTAYTVGAWRRSQSSSRVMECTVAGTSGASQPLWDTAAVGDVFVDGTVTWVVRSTALGVAKARASVAA